MSTTRQAAKKTAQPDTNGQSNGEADEKAAAQAAQQAEAQETPRTVDFDGHTYTILDGQPSPKAITYIARYAVDDEQLAFVPAMVEMIGREQWAAWCERHTSSQMMDFWEALNEASRSGN